MKFNNKFYQDVYLEYKIEQAETESKKNLGKYIKDGLKGFVANYLPFVGYLPVETQENLKVRKKLFKGLNIETAVLASAVDSGLGAYLIGQKLDGFDIGFEMMKKVRVSWRIAEMPTYISLTSWLGISKAFTQVASYYLMAESAIRAGALLLGKPLGNLIAEGISYAVKKGSKKSKFMKQRNEKILREKEHLDYVEKVTEKDRKDIEKDLARLTLEMWGVKNKGETANFYEAKSESLIRKLETI